MNRNKLICINLFVLCFFILLFNAKASTSLPFQSEYIVVVMNNSLVFDALENTKKNGDAIIHILSWPEKGLLQLNSNQTFTYKPKLNICEEVDFFIYRVIHNSGIVDTVEVAVEILCESVTILSGFSPDGDGINDTFTILGSQNYPDNTLAIFNNKGEEVFYTHGYRNDWKGDNAIHTTSDSLYYYVFHDGVDKYYSGYMKINL